MNKHWSQEEGYPCSNMLLAALMMIEARLPSDIENPFRNEAAEFICDKFAAISYDWREDYEYGFIQPYNFKWKDFEVKWYKYLGRGMEFSRVLSNDEIATMLNECLECLENYND